MINFECWSLAPPFCYFIVFVNPIRKFVKLKNKFSLVAICTKAYARPLRKNHAAGRMINRFDPRKNQTVQENKDVKT